MNTVEFIDTYWSHYIALEKELYSILQYVELDEKNYKTFSERFSKLILQIGSEIDIVGKIYCKMLDNNFKGKSINTYQDCIKVNKPNFIIQEVKIINRELKLKPWENWSLSANNPPYWWTAYNKIKHCRTDIVEINGIKQKASIFSNLEYTLNSLAGLYQLLIYIYYDLAINENKRIKTPLPGSRLFSLESNGWEDVDFYKDVAFYINMDDGILYMESGRFIY